MDTKESKTSTRGSKDVSIDLKIREELLQELRDRLRFTVKGYKSSEGSETFPAPPKEEEG
jgi:hypothetical protein